MKEKSKGPKFFCDYCGTEVSQDEQCCPKCGRYFSTIRCPACGFSGTADKFAKGCPVCGYSAPPQGKQPKSGNARAHSSHETAPPPVWLYIVTGGLLLVIVWALMRCLN